MIIPKDSLLNYCLGEVEKSCESIGQLIQRVEQKKDDNRAAGRHVLNQLFMGREMNLFLKHKRQPTRCRMCLHKLAIVWGWVI